MQENNCHFPKRKKPQKNDSSSWGVHTISPDCGRLKIEDKRHKKVNLLSPAEGENQHPIPKLDLVDQ